MNQSFGQFCPVALASEVLTQRWMLLIVRELMAGCSRFNDIRRGIPKISATLLKQRLETLERAEIVEKRPLGKSDKFEYFLTEAGLELNGLIAQIGQWGQRWARDMEEDDLDPSWFVWNMHRRLDLAAMPAGRVVIQIEFTDTPARERFFWIVKNEDTVDVCLKPPGFDTDVKVTSPILVLVEIWRGLSTLNAELARGTLTLEGNSKLRQAFPKWLLLSHYASIKRMKPSFAAS